MGVERSKLGWPRRRLVSGQPDERSSSLGWPSDTETAPAQSAVSDQLDEAEIATVVDDTPVVSRETATARSADLVSCETVDESPADDVSRETATLDSGSVVDQDEAAAAGSAIAEQATSSAAPDVADLDVAPPVSPLPESDAAQPGEPVSRETPISTEVLPRPVQTRVLTVSNQKGGVGKTTTTVNLAVALAMRGARVLVIDLDPQGNASTGLGIDHPNGTPSTYDVIVDKASISDTAQPVVVDGVPDGALLCVPATSDLAGAEVELAAVVVGREFRLKQAIEAYLDGGSDDERLDYVFIDCPPSLGLLTVNALAGAGEVLIPIQCEYYALEGLGQLLETIELIHGYLNPKLHVSTMLLTMFDARTKLAGQVVDEVREHFGETVMRTIIPRSVKVSEAPSYRQSVMTYDPASRGAISYLTAAREFAQRGVRD